jgi:DNA repair photolyase
MIVSASYRTDIPAFYGAWFGRRLEAGYAMVANPYGGPAYRVDLAPQAVDGFVFWSRNTAPFLAQLEAVRGLGVPFVVQFTLTAYPRALEASVPAPAEGIRQIALLAERYGPRAVVWRYDPVLRTSLTEADFHRATFRRLAAALEGLVDEACISFAHIYAKTRRNLETAARRHGLAWDDPEAEEKRRLRAELEAIARGHGMVLSVCSQPELGGRAATCVDAARLSDLAGRPLAARRKGNRPGCECAESRDIGAYDSCPHGCVYCYAVAGRARVRARHRAHDPMSEYLIPPTLAV